MAGFSLRNPHTIIVGALIITLLGIVAFTEMPVDVFPSMHVPVAVVATFYPGLPPLDINYLGGAAMSQYLLDFSRRRGFA
jgi:hydrophobic/amphiphilic exporter-1 (mainly G- bacteria), HAE1 family